VRGDLLLFDQPRKALGRTVGAVGSHIIRLQAEAILRSFERGASCTDLGLANGACGFDIDNHPVVGIDQIIGGISKEGMALVRPGSDGEMNFGVTGNAAPKAASSSVARYSLDRPCP
jgi:hypothetical protein